MWSRERGWRWLAGVTALVLSACAVMLATPGSRASAAATSTPSVTAPSVDGIQTGSPPAAPALTPADTSTTTTGATTTTSTGTGTTTTGADAGTTTQGGTVTSAVTTSTTPTGYPQPVQVQVSEPTVTYPLPAGFLGFSIEFSAIHAYLGRNPSALNPVFLQLVSGIDQGHNPIVRIGGNSTDNSWLAIPGVLPPLADTYAITDDWIATVSAMVRKLDARLILGVNLSDDDPQIAGVESRALVAGIGSHYIEDLEVGNEPDLYLRPWYDLPNGTAVTHRAGRYTASTYNADFQHWREVLPNLPLAAGALATLGWLGTIDPVVSGYRDVSTVSVHRYALTNCGVAPSSSLFPSIANLFSASATEGLASPLGPYAQALHAAGINLRVDELNTASCEGAPGVSDTFASSLWMLNELFDMAAAGVDGVNVHTLPGSHYAPFTFSDDNGQWTAEVRPDYYGMLMFASAFPAGAELLTSTDSSTAAGGLVKAYTTETSDGTLRTTLINESSTDATVQLQLPTTSTTATAESLTAPSLTATTGVALGGQSFADPTTTGTLAAPVTSQLTGGAAGSFSVPVPADSATLLTVPG